MAQLSTAIAQAVTTVVPEPSSSPSPAATPTPVPTPVPKARGGPLQFSVSGSLSLGSQSSAFSQTGLDGSGLSSGFSSNTAAAGMLAELTKRGATSTFDVRLPLGISNQNGTTLGDAAVTYATPHYLFGYGPRPLTLFGQLALGNTSQGYYLTLPNGQSGDATLIEGQALGAQGETVHVFGLLGRRLSGVSIYEYGLYSNLAAPVTGQAETAVGGYATSKGKAQIAAEVAVQHRQTPDGPTGGVAFQGTLNYGARQDNATVTLRSVPQRFLSYGLGEVYGDKDAELSFHRYRGKHAFNIDLGYDTSSYLDDVTNSKHVLAGFSGPLGKALYALTVQDQSQGGTAPRQWTGSAAVQLSVPLRNASLLGTAQLQRQTQVDAPASSLSTYGFNAYKYFCSLSVNMAFQSQHQSTSETDPSRIRQTVLGISKTFHKSTVGFQYTLQRSQTALADALQRSSQIFVARQISPAITLQVNYGQQALTDANNPGANGRSHTFGVQINSPFAFGNGVAQGRVDPRLPATIVGRVQADLGQNLQFASYASGGVGNVVVILDGTQLQRTDLQGNFQFSFVQPGQHQIRIETSSIPRGLTADQPVITLNVEGGQVVQAQFLVGDFGGISGHVFGTDSNGARIPLRNVVLRVDEGAFSQTDADGNYGFGRLSPGDHTISINLATVPAFASFDKKDLTRTVTVDKGVLTTVNFDAQPLGSITGSILYAPDMGKPIAGLPVENAYVVAEPGEHAAIVDGDGTFVVDDLPPGDYTLSVDTETIPDGLGAGPDSIAVSLTPQEHYKGAAFLVGHSEKKVTFSFVGSGVADASAPSIHLSEKRLPPGGYAKVTVNAPKTSGSISVTGIGSPAALTYDAKAAAWVGGIQVPADAKDGDYPLTAKVASGTPPQGATLTVDVKIPLALVQLLPPNAKPGQVVGVRIRFLADVHEGDVIEWADRQKTTLPKPVSGRIFTFSLRLSLRPLHGTLLTRAGRLPIEIL